MLINRRTAIRNFLIVSAGVTLIPSCLQEKSKSSILLKNFTISAGQENLLAELSETIIPATDTPGAKDVSAHLFALKMLDDCRPHTDQQNFVKGLDAFEEAAKKRFDHSFVKCTQAEREALLTDIENKKVSAEITDFYSTLKKFTIQACLTSKYYLTNIQVYQLVPGRYHGCVPVNQQAS